ncbi:hypothetical protein BVRB_6g151030 [Beta vulgaris subsp. vulgaris]|nr:uncharacterized protein LOC104897587 isoform X2 [Beta vulgaris subsp. vulgaris]XP_048502551.1 uncharacterized protein LOC104897587 isoform X2 [Beta vulgaris subsp. vulgaris]XP_048502552.1 uncharacterized protein LOC104897587 isoform X2 [Beta vulgaris subsp. vulgaris]KMT07486.1 hypothetical protein BVRB_6g151030 [Beta vulgaris subsp. vulgaris]
MEGEGKVISNPDDEVREILAEFMVGVIKFEELVEVGRKSLIRFQQALEFLRHPSIYESSELVKNILKMNETMRVTAYIEAGCINAYDSTQSVVQMNTSLCNLQDCLTKANDIINNLENLMDKAGNALCMNSDDQLETELQGSEQEVTSPEKLDAANCASFMAVIYSMVKQDYTMQEKIVSSLNFKSSSDELESYRIMWTLRPFVDDDVVHQALAQVK